MLRVKNQRERTTLTLTPCAKTKARRLAKRHEISVSRVVEILLQQGKPALRAGAALTVSGILFLTAATWNFYQESFGTQIH